MSYKAKVYAVGTELEFEEVSLKEMWKRLAFFQSLPDTCPIDDTPTRLFYKEPEGNSYFSVVSSGQLHFEYKLGQYKEAKDDLFGKGEWWWWDYTNKVDVLLCKWGELTEEGEAMRERMKGSAPVAHKGPQATQPQQTANRTAQPAQAPQRPATAVEREIMGIDVADAEPLPFDDGNPFDGPVLTTPDQRKEMHALGTLLYEGKWDTKRENFVKHYGLESSNELNVEQWQGIMVYLEEQAQIAINRHSDKFAPGELVAFKTTYHALKELKARLKKLQPA